MSDANATSIERMNLSESECRQRLSQTIKLAWRAFDNAVSLHSCVKAPAPILFFGDLGAYLASPCRILTVGLNPSWHEFPKGDQFRRFAFGGGSGDRAVDRYLEVLSAYFRTDPYERWFRAYEKLLIGAGSSYYAEKAPSTALHTDICSPVATYPTWSRLARADRAALKADGCNLWHELLHVLRPQIVLLSIAKHRLQSINFTPVSNWVKAHIFDKKGDGCPRRRPYVIRVKWYNVGDKPSLFVFGQAAQLPFGLLHGTQKHETGLVALSSYQND